MLTLPLLPIVATAQPTPTRPPAGDAADSNDQRARAHFERGRDAYKDGRYRDAWAEFHEAYALSKRPELLFNIGQTADRLGRDSDAIKAFELYLRKLPDAANRRDVENRLRALREQSASRQPDPESAPPVAAEPVQPVRPDASQPAASTDPRGPRRSRPLRAATPPPRAAAEPEPTKASGPRRGLYLRAAGGVGYRYNSFTITDGFDELDLELSGFGLALDIAAGWAVLPGFVVGGGLFLDWTSRPRASLSSGDGNEVQLGHANLTTIGPFIDWYPKRQDLGLHIEGGLGLGLLSYALDDESSDESGSATGVSFFLGTGWEFKIAGAFAMGVLFRVTAAVLSEESAVHAFVSPSLLMSFTWF